MNWQNEGWPDLKKKTIWPIPQYSKTPSQGWGAKRTAKVYVPLQVLWDQQCVPWKMKKNKMLKKIQAYNSLVVSEVPFSYKGTF